VTTTAWVLFAVSALVAATDWIAVATSKRRLEYAAKPVVVVGLIAVAIALHPVSSIERGWFVGALALGLLSDVFLMLPQDMFVAGLAAALVEHVAYIAGFRARDLNIGLLVVGAVVATLSAAAVLPPVYRSLRKTRPGLVTPVIAYSAIFIVMVTSAGGTGSGVAFGGALLFFYSDALLAWNRFVKPVGWGRFVNIVAYHSGQALLVLSLAS
jgi:uncharacterized membrane protein YhhN